MRTPWRVLAGGRLAGGANRPPGAVIQGAGDERWTAEDRGRTGLSLRGPGFGMATYRTVIDSLYVHSPSVPPAQGWL